MALLKIFETCDEGKQKLLSNVTFRVLGNGNVEMHT